jgi:prepilin-type N-terminal cleavage/methylation domain-containing protein
MIGIGSGVSEPRAESGRSRDAGFGLLEVIVAVVLLGLGAAGTMTAISISIRGAAEETRLSGARRWLAGAADYVVSADVPRIPCSEGEAAVRASYQEQARSVTTGRPNGWNETSIGVVAPVLFWDGTSFGSTCHETEGLRLQLVTLRATSPTGKETETVTVVKQDG